ncbi:MAG: DHHA1 domain-containing protein [Chloroflexota bacterium]|nr:DHHA1 domain-containing protein [Chloroflexota bacterium]
MTSRLYHTEPYQTHFEARVVEALTWDGRPAVVLDRTAFYPASGGQPADAGVLGGVPVVDVVARESDGAIVHVLSQELSDQTVAGQVDWERRFDHMQQHTGQHILSAAFEKELGAETVGFHLGGDSSTIDLDVPGLKMEDVEPVEALANEMVWADREVAVRFVGWDALAALCVEPPPDVEGPIRLIVIPGPRGEAGTEFDVNPCGGTHVARTGEIGTIKIVGLEHRGDQTRVTFLCGGRALRDYGDKSHVIDELTGRLTVGYWELDEAVERLQEENKELRRSERELRQRLLGAEAVRLVESAEARGPYRLVSRVWQGRSSDELRILARKLAEHSAVVALLFTIDERTHLCFARAEDLTLDMNLLVQDACRRLHGRGGGRAQIAQGSAPATDVSEVERVVSELLTGLGPL